MINNITVRKLTGIKIVSFIFIKINVYKNIFNKYMIHKILVTDAFIEISMHKICSVCYLRYIKYL